MTITPVKALVATRRFIAPSDCIQPVQVCLDLYPKRYDNKIVFTIQKTDESDGKYGPNARQLMPTNRSGIIDTYA